MSPALALAWMIWTRHRRGLTILGGLWLASIVLLRSLLINADHFALLEVLCGLPILASIFGFAFLFGIFTFSHGARLEARESGFPTSLWHLPLRTAALVGWPMLWGTAVVALACLSLAWGLRPLFRAWPGNLWFGWLALMPAVALAWMQALTWSPFPLPGLRAVVLFPLTLAGIFYPLYLIHGLGFDESIGYGLLVVQLPAAYALAVFGVARARRGDVPNWTWPRRLRRTSAPTVARPFASPAQAQLWFEWRCRGLIFPLFLGAVLLLEIPSIPSLAWTFEDTDRVGFAVVPSFLLHDVGSLWLAAASVLFLLPPLVASMCGLMMGPLPGRDRTRTLSSFLATRPVSVGVFVRAKFQIAALSTLAAWGLMAVGFLLWFTLSGYAQEMTVSFDALRQRHSAGSFWASLVVLIAGAIVLTWLQLIKGLWVGLAGRALSLPSRCFGVAVFVGAVAFGQWLANSPEYWPPFAVLLPWFAALVVALKSLAAAWSLRALRRYGLVSTSDLRRAMLLWIALAGGVFGVLGWLLPRDMVPLSALVLGIVLLLPFTRLTLALRALNWNRHR